MQTHQGIDRFNLIAATIFTELYEAFPDPATLTAERIAALSLPKEAAAEETIEYQKSAMHVVSWLSVEGLLRFEQQVYGGFVGISLSMKALTVLGFIPDALRAAPEPFIDRLKGALGKGAKDAASEGIKQVLGGIFDLALRYGQSGTSVATLVA